MRNWRLLLPFVLLIAGCQKPEATSRKIEAYGVVADAGRLGKTLNLFTWPDYLDPDLVREFESKYGVKLQIDYYDTNEAMLAKLRGGGLGQYDLIVASDYAVETLTADSALQPLDYANIPNARNIDARFRGLPFDPQNRYTVPYQWGTSGLGIRTDRIKKQPPALDTWKLVFDPAYQVGPLVMLNDQRETIGAALIYLGLSPNTTSPADLARAEQLLVAQRPRVLTYSPFATARDLLASGDVVVAHNYSGDVLLAKADAPGIQFVIPREGSLIWTDNMAIPVRAPDRYAAELFINFLLDAKVGARLSNFTQYATPNAAAFPLIADSLRNDRSIYPDSTLMARLHFLRDVGPARRLYDELWTRLRAGG